MLDRPAMMDAIEIERNGRESGWLCNYAGRNPLAGFIHSVSKLSKLLFLWLKPI